MAILIPRGFLTPGSMEAMEFQKSICPPHEPEVDFNPNGNTPDRVTPNIVFRRRVFRDFNLPLPFANPTTGQPSILMWVIEDLAGGNLQFPSPAIRVREGQIVHTETQTRQGHHTIHHHGIEPTPMNDGVGHTSFEIENGYTYQWQANQAGTYFYHCHMNTVLHFEMGMYGMLIVDPPVGPGFVAGFNPPNHLIRYDVEAFWVPDEFDSRWHNDLDVDHHMADCGTIDPITGAVIPADPNDPATFHQFNPAEVNLNDFRPDIFVITGVPRVNDNTPISDPRVAITARVGQTILIRLLNAGYTFQRYTIGLNSRAIAQDGRPFGVPPFGRYSQPINIPANRPFWLGTAERWDLIITPTQTGQFPATVEYFDVITRERYAIARTTITVNP